MLYESEPALVSAIPLLSNSGERALPVGSEPIYVSIIFLDDFLAEYLGDQYVIAKPQFLQNEREEARHRALHDPLTGLGNRSLFHAKLLESMRQIPRGAPSLALLALDLDRFKQVNDTMGHAAGDELLR